MDKENTKKMTVKEFINKYNTLTNKDLKNNFLKSVIKDSYIPFENKITICEKIMESSYYIKTKDKNGNERKKFHINSPAKYMLYCMNMVKYYTSIDIDFQKCLEEFNLLNGCGCIDMIFDYIPEREKREFKTILTMVENDVIQNEYEIHAFIKNQIERVGELAGATISPLLEQLMQSINKIDKKTIDKLLDEFIK